MSPRTHADPHEIPDALGIKAIPTGALRKTGRWEHPEGFVLRELEPFRKKVASTQGPDVAFRIEAYLTTDEESVMLVARPSEAPPLD